MKSFLQFLLESDINVIFVKNSDSVYRTEPKSFYDQCSCFYFPSINTIGVFYGGAHLDIAEDLKAGKRLLCNDKKICELLKTLYKEEYKSMDYEHMYAKMGIIRFGIPRTYDLLISADASLLEDVSKIINYVCSKAVITTITLEIYNYKGKDAYVQYEFENSHHIPNTVEKVKAFLDTQGREAKI